MNPYVIPGLMSLEEIAASIWKVHPSLLHTNSRNRDVVECRQVLLSYVKSTTKLSRNEVGKLYKRDRNTVKHACETVANLRQTNQEFRKKYELFIKRIPIVS